MSAPYADCAYFLTVGCGKVTTSEVVFEILSQLGNTACFGAHSHNSVYKPCSTAWPLE